MLRGMIQRALLFCLPAILAGCSMPSASDRPADTALAPTEQSSERRADQDPSPEKKLRDKRRELRDAGIEAKIAGLDRALQSKSVVAAVAEAEAELEQAKRALKAFLEDVKPRELEEHRISLDQAIYSAEHSKEELAELTAMYEEDEFARSTKELVLKRGRRSAEMAERRLAVERSEMAHFEQHVLPERERKLRREVTSAELALEKAKVEVQKHELQAGLDLQKEQDKRQDLEAELAALSKGGAEVVK